MSSPVPSVNDEEKAKQQDVIVNLEIRYRANTALRSDEPADALNYKTITKRMIEHIELGRFNLLKKLTADLVVIANASEQVSFARIRVDKPHALRFVDSVLGPGDSVAAAPTRTRREIPPHQALVYRNRKNTQP